MLPGVNVKLAWQLLDLADKQNVPKVVILLQSLLQLKDLSTSNHPAENQKQKAIIFAAEFMALCALSQMLIWIWLISLKIWLHILSLLLQCRSNIVQIVWLVHFMQTPGHSKEHYIHCCTDAEGLCWKGTLPSTWRYRLSWRSFWWLLDSRSFLKFWHWATWTKVGCCHTHSFYFTV